MDNFFFLFSLCFFAFESLFFSLVFSLFFRSSPNQVSKAKTNHSGSLSNPYPYLFLGQNPKSNPMIFLPLFAGFNWDEFIRFVVYDWRWVSIEMSLLDLGLQFMIRMRWWGICWVWEIVVYDRDEVVGHLLGLVFQVPIGVFVGFGFIGSN